jgi:spermidine/putrescine transport system ATP-binding protein
MTESDVSIRKLYKRFGDLIAVDSIDLEVPRGAFVTFLGPSGCGKTTTLRMIGGFEHPDSGQILIKGEEMGNRPPHKRDTSMVFQNYALFPHMSVADNIGFGLRERKVPKTQIRERVQQMLELVELPDRGERKPRQLSGGQQQRVALARSLVIEPTVLLLDEPLGALDLKLRKQMQIELKRIQQQVGITFIYVTHDQEEALTMSDRIVVMNEGHVEQEGSAEEIFEQPRTRFVAEFMGGQNILDADITDRDNGSSRLRIGSREMTMPRRVSGDARTAAVVVRPEKIRMDVADGWQGIVEDRLYKGSIMSYIIRLDDGTVVTAEVAHDDPTHRHTAGDEVTISWRPEDIVVIPDQARGA